MRLSTLWLIQWNAFFWCFLGETVSFGICDFASSLAVQLLLLIAGIALLVFVVCKNKDYQNYTSAGSFVVSLVLSPNALCRQKCVNKPLCYLLFIPFHDVR